MKAVCAIAQVGCNRLSPVLLSNDVVDRRTLPFTCSFYRAVRPLANRLKHSRSAQRADVAEIAQFGSFLPASRWRVPALTQRG